MADPARARILIADDQPDVLEALRLLLSQHEFSAELVTSPPAVLAITSAPRSGTCC